MKTQTVSDVVEEKNIPLDEILDVFEGYGYGKEEMQDFLDSGMTDLSDAFPELKELLNGKKRKPKSPVPSEEKLDYEIVNDKSLDAIKDNFTPPGAKGEKKMSKRMFSPDMLCPKCKEPMLYQAKGGIIKCSKCGNEVGEKELDNLDLYKSPNIENDDFDEDELYDQMESMGDMPSDMQLHKALKKADTNDNGKIEVDEMADFQKSLDDYAAKNKKGRDDIPVTTRR